MPNYALMTSVGRDRPGIVAAIARVLLEADCNIEDSRMAQLGSDFACMLMLAMPDGVTGMQLSERMNRAREEYGLWVHVTDLPPEQATSEPHEQPVYNIRVYGADRKGIVYRITQHLADQQINISNLQTEVIPHKQPLYVMLIEVELPPFVDVGTLSSALSRIGDEIGVRVSVKQKDDARF